MRKKKMLYIYIYNRMKETDKKQWIRGKKLCMPIKIPKSSGGGSAKKLKKKIKKGIDKRNLK